MRVMAKVNYHIQSDSRQAFQFDVDGVIGNLVSPELVEEEVSVQDVRTGSPMLGFNKDGITFVKSESNVKRFESSTDWKSVYEEELRILLKREIDAKEVIVFDHTVRVDEPDAIRKPARNVHNDYSESGAEQRLVDLLGEDKAESFSNGSFAFVNVWRPIECSIKSSPLGFILPSSMQPEDWITIDLVYPDRLGQILGVIANSKHQWFYMSEMNPDEVAIFNIYDNKGRPHLAHSALDMEGDESTRVPRKSIESRTLVQYN